MDFEQLSGKVYFEKDRITIGADYCFEEQCKHIASKIGQNQDSDVNYYDATG